MDLHILEIVETIGSLIEIIGVAAIVVGLFYAGYVAVRNGVLTGYATFRVVFGRALLLGLEILVAGDIIKTVALTPTLESIATLGLLVVIRTFLGWALFVEIEGHWPWHSEGLEPDSKSSG